ncbi:MAG: sensor histidine kinase [Acidobacteriia bacterium]|nr:sensor histidine kinase [Terriglobia bacterium]
MRETQDLTLPCLVHDLNNVFQTLVEAADLLSTDPRWGSLSAAILRSVERGKNLTTTILSADEGSAGFESILNNAISFVEDSLIAGRTGKILFDCKVDPGIELRRNWAWERVLINLFSNAVRVMPEGGTIYVSARRMEDDAAIMVRDEGPGIAPEILADIFKPHVSTRGSGLGLHIVETIVKQEDGSVRASNRIDGRGAEFTIRVPLRKPALLARV